MFFNGTSQLWSASLNGTSLPGQGPNSSSIVTVSFNYTNGVNVLSSNSYVDIELSLIPKYPSNYDSGRFPNIKCGDFSSNHYSSQSSQNYIYPNNKPSQETFWSSYQGSGTGYSIGQKHTGGCVEQGTGDWGLYSGGYGNPSPTRLPQRWGKRIVIRCIVPMQSTNSGGKTN